jgi:hypothetical protein
VANVDDVNFAVDIAKKKKPGIGKVEGDDRIVVWGFEVHHTWRLVSCKSNSW